MYNQMGNSAAGESAIFEGEQVETASLPAGPSKYSWDNFSAFISDDYYLVLTRLAKKYGDIFQLHLSNRKLLVLSGQAIKDSLKNTNNFLDKADFRFFQKDPVVHFLELKSGESWKKHDEVVSVALRDAFGGKWGNIEDWLKIEADDMIESLLQTNGRPTDPGRRIALTSFSFWHKMIFGERSSDMVNERFDSEGLNLVPCAFMNAVRVDIAPKPFLPLMLLQRKKLLKGLQENLVGITGYITNSVDRQRQIVDLDDPKCIADYLLKSIHELSEADRKKYNLYDEDIVLGTIFQASTAGTAVASFAIRWALLYLIYHPEMQTRIQEELDSVVGRDRVPLLSDRSKCIYTQAFIHEVLRHSSLSPMSPVYYLSTSDGDTSVNDTLISRRTPVVVNYYSLTRDPALWDRPDEFDPERFIDADGNIDKDAVNQFYPFGVGSRRCIGEHLGRMQIFLLFSRLMQELRFERVNGDNPTLKGIPGAFMVPKNFELIIRPRPQK